MTKPSQVIMDAALSLVQTVAADEAFVSAVAEQEIARRIALGELVPRERLQIMPGLELAPAGRLAALERAARTVVKYAEEMPPEQAWTDEERLLQTAIRQLQSALNSDDEVEDEAGTNEVSLDDSAPPPSTARTTAPDEDDTGPCEQCGAEITMPGQARLSWMRWRRVLCIDDHRAEPDRRAAEEAQANPAAVDEPATEPDAPSDEEE